MQNSINKNLNKNNNDNLKQQRDVLANAAKIITGDSKLFTPDELLKNHQLLEKVSIVKKDGTLEKFDFQKIINAISKSASRMLITFSEIDLRRISDIVEREISYLNKNNIDIKEIHFIVEKALDTVNPKVAESYRNYRNYKTDFVKMLHSV
ncbi:MAG: ATP cone domain-containing protein, partial [Candidatus Gastranaerophilaceae bacterium]